MPCDIFRPGYRGSRDPDHRLHDLRLMVDAVIHSLLHLIQIKDIRHNAFQVYLPGSNRLDGQRINMTVTKTVWNFSSLSSAILMGRVISPVLL